MFKLIGILLLYILPLKAAEFSRTYNLLNEFSHIQSDPYLKHNTLAQLSDDLCQMDFKTLPEIKEYKKINPRDAYYNIFFYYLTIEPKLTFQKQYYAFEALIKAVNLNHPKALTVLALYLKLEPFVIICQFPDLSVKNYSLYIKRAAFGRCPLACYMYGDMILQSINNASNIIENPILLHGISDQDFFKVKKAMYWIKRSGFFKIVDILEEEF